MAAVFAAKKEIPVQAIWGGPASLAYRQTEVRPTHAKNARIGRPGLRSPQLNGPERAR